MPRNPFSWIKRIAIRLVASLKRFPIGLMMAFLAVLTLIIQNHFYASPNQNWLLLCRLSMIFSLGFPVALCLKVIHERFILSNTVKWGLYIVAALSLGCYFQFFLPDLHPVNITRYIAVSVAFYLAFLSIPYMSKRDNYELYLIKVLGDLFIALIFGLIVYAGCSAMLFSLTALFGMNWGMTYYDIWLIIMGVFVPAFFLAEVPSSQTEYQLRDYPPFLKILLLYIMIPMLTLYSSILYFYFAKILFSHNWPVGIVSHLVLWYALIAVAVIFFITPLRQREPWARIFLNLFPKFILPLLAMMLVAMGIRVNAYGFTENRCFVIAAGLWSIGSMLYFFTKKERGIMLLISLAVLTILSVSGPWSVFNISKTSQINRLELLLTQGGNLRNGVLQPCTTLSEKTKREIASILTYFEENHNLNEIPLLPPGFNPENSQPVLGFDISEETVDIQDKSVAFSQDFLTGGEIIDIAGYDYMAYLCRPVQEDILSSKSFKIAYSTDRRLTIINQGKPVYSENINHLAVRLLKKASNEKTHFPDRLTHRVHSKNLQIYYIFNRIDGSKDTSKNEYIIDFLDFYLFVHIKK